MPFNSIRPDAPDLHTLRMTRFATLLLIAAALTACAGPAPEVSEPAVQIDPGPFSVILFIGDGTGLSHWTAARIAYNDLAIDRFPVVGLVGTRSSNSRITDSAAGATAFAAGVKTYNGAIGMGPDTTAVRTVLELAAHRGKATGLVATSTLTHATPASFAAHVPSREFHFEIAEQLAEADVDVMLGGGRGYFDPAVRPDGENLLAELRDRATVVDTAPALLELDLSMVERLVGFTSSNNPPTARKRSPNLAQLTEMALQVLERDRDGFFLMVEGSQIDWASHDKASFDVLLPEIQDLDMAIRSALQFQKRRPNTLVVVVADHETGGLALHGDEMGVFRAHYTTDGHTATMVPLFAIGPGANAMAGIMENDYVGRVLLELVREDGPTAEE